MFLGARIYTVSESDEKCEEVTSDNGCLEKFRSIKKEKRVHFEVGLSF